MTTVLCPCHDPSAAQRSYRYGKDWRLELAVPKLEGSDRRRGAQITLWLFDVLLVSVRLLVPSIPSAVRILDGERVYRECREGRHGLKG